MFGSSQVRGANAYAKVGIETGVVAASPHKLIVMLFDGAIVAISNAQQHLGAGDVASKGQAISKAIAIIENGLRASLDKKAGGEIAVSLDSLYEYMTARLLQANLENNDLMLTEVQNLLRDLKTSWEAIAPTKEVTTEVPKVNIDPLSPRPANFVEA
ncbi:MAG: flagellar export chaperone FliS [Burkholderiales bacterium]|nr:flagellar export chaperone FliS [Burkholderiales bacterium]MBI3728188.1 flagellar export chaperone FliS [Burkholderiales bacterium]